ncbi:hypothetical protein CR155_09775 [Pollutimonas nitritireducens]|uniref:Uncharacterized protein n=1 Tax=Pollutimonas nitritireducens TaxID=2045209 RepID=A0A2N4UFE0_9BURK|nr:hypothetical protein [Pollutimonas nitritireducens]PLC53738.1 hypothetical protein CR155_09775 [Pollutimonas nitritireducens]
MPYFTQLGAGTDPEDEVLHNFMDGARRFLHDLLTQRLQLVHPQPEVAPLLYKELRQEALAVFLDYVYDHFEQLQHEIRMLDEDRLAEFGLSGESLHQQLRKLAELETSPGDESAYWPRVGKMLQELDTTLDTILDPLKSSAPRIGEFIGLFKDFRAPVLDLVNG